MIRRGIFATSLLVLLCLLGSVLTVQALKYGAGSFGTCAYNGPCTISLITTGTVALPVTPTAAGVCTTASDSVTVTTSAPTGYQLSVNDDDAQSVMSGQAFGGSVAATTGTIASPVGLTMNSWGFRIDGSGSFGSGPTSVLNNAAVPGVSFARVPASTSPATIASTAIAAPSGQTTTVWYGVCANTTKLADTYKTVVTYTAIVNP